MSCPPVTIRPDSTTEQIERLLARRTLSAVPVVDQADQLVGLVSRTDLLRAPRDPCRPVSSLMSTRVVVVPPDEVVEAAIWQMVASRFHRLVVADGGHVVGVLSARDVLAHVTRRPFDERLETVMRAPAETISIGASLEEAVERLIAANVHGLAVVDGSRPVGVFTQREALATRRLPQSLQSRPVEELMRFDPLCLELSVPTGDAAARALATRAARILVTEGKHLVGVASNLDLLAAVDRPRPSEATPSPAPRDSNLGVRVAATRP